jgi:hypothetical protein
MQSTKKEIIKNIYLYLVTFIGLFMIVVPAVDIIKISLEKWVFPLASQDEYNYEARVPEPLFAEKQISADSDEEIKTLDLTAGETEMFERWKKEFKSWEEKEKNKDRVAIRRQKSLVRDISLLMGGLALFLTHGYIIKRKKHH